MAKAPLAGNRIIWVAGRDRLDGNSTDWQSIERVGPVLRTGPYGNTSNMRSISAGLT